MIPLLAEAWALGGTPAPDLHDATPGEMPVATAVLLTSTDGLTAALTRRWGVPPGLRLVGQSRSETRLVRLVALTLGADGPPLEIAAIRVHLDAFDGRTRQAVLAGAEPFGAVLAGAGLTFRSEPLRFLALRADPLIARHGAVPEGTPLFGRECRILGEQTYAEAVEILTRA